MNRPVSVLLFAGMCFAHSAGAAAAPALDAQGYLSKCHDSSDASQYVSVIDFCSAALQAGGLDKAGTATAYLYRGMAHHSRNEDDPAIADLSAALAADPSGRGADFAHFERGVVYLARKQYDKALPDFDAAVTLSPSEAIYYELRGTAYFDLGHRQEALWDLSKAIDLKPNEANAYSQRSVVYLMQGYYPGAIADSVQVLVINPEDKSARTVMGEGYYFLGKPSVALRKFDEALTKFPGDDYAMIWRYLAAQRSGHDIGKSFAAGFESMRNHEAWTYLLGQLYLGKTTRGKVLAAATAATPDPALQKQVLCQAKAFMGEYYRNKGQRDTATTLFKEAAPLCGQDSVGHIMVEQGLNPPAAGTGAPQG